MAYRPQEPAAPRGAAARANPLEFARSETGPAREGAREMCLIGVAEVERDLDDLAGWILQHLLRNVEAGSRDDAGVRHPFVGQATL